MKNILTSTIRLLKLLPRVLCIYHLTNNRFYYNSAMASAQNPIKAALRVRIKALMALMTPENRREQSSKITEQVFRLFKF